MTKKYRGPIKRLLLSHEVRDLNELASYYQCDCDCHNDSMWFSNHLGECCYSEYSQRVSIGDYTEFSPIELKQFIDKGLSVYHREIFERERDRRCEYWKAAIVDTPLNKSTVNPTDKMVEIYVDYITGKIELTECIDEIIGDLE